MPPNDYLRFILQAARQAPSADNSQPWALRWQHSTLSVSYDSARVADKTFPADDPATLVAIGAVLENVVQLANAAQWKFSQVLSSSLNQNNLSYFDLSFQEPDRELDIGLIESHPVFKRHTNRLPYSNQPLPVDLTHGLKSQTLASNRVMVFDDPGNIQHIAKLVCDASEIRFRTPEVLTWLAKSLRFDTASASRGDGLDVNTLDLPIGGKLFLRLITDWQRMKFFNLFGAYKVLSFIDSMPVKQSATLVAIVGPRGFQDTLHAGQLMERIWIDLNAQGIAVHPYYVISDQLNRHQANSVPGKLIKNTQALLKNTQDQFKLNDGETLHMLLRVGYPKQVAKFSKRLPLETIYQA